MSREGSTSPATSDEGKERVFTCTMCSYHTDRKNNLKRHTMTMHEVCQVLLECCGFRFLNKAGLRNHTNKLHKNGYKCDICRRVFCRKALLKRHYSVHTGYKEFSCRQCVYQTSHKSNLQRHMKTHPKAVIPQHLLEPTYLPEFSQPTSHLSSAVSLQQALLPTHHISWLSEYHRGRHFYRQATGGPSCWSMLPVLSPDTLHQQQQQHQSSPVHHQSSPVHHQSPPLHHQSSPLYYQSSPLHYQSSPLQHQSPPLHHQSPPLHYQSSPLHYQSSPLQHQSPPLHHQSSPLYYQSPPLHHQSPPLQHQSPPLYYQSPPLHHQSPPLHHQSPPLHQSSPFQQESPPQLYSAESQPSGPRMGSSCPKKKIPSSSFSMEAILAEEPHQTHQKDIPEAGVSYASTSLHRPPPPDFTWWQVRGEEALGTYTHTCMSTGVVKPTAFHANTALNANTAFHANFPNYALDLSRASTSSQQDCYMGEAQESTSAVCWPPTTGIDTHDLPYLDLQGASLSQTPGPDTTTPGRPHTPAREHQGSSASSGYGSPGVNESPIIPGPSHGTEEELERALNLKVKLQPQPLLEMEVDQEYVPKKLRLSKKFKGAKKFWRVVR